MRRIISAIAVLIGTIIGVGIFGIPYAITKVGIYVGMAYIILIAFIILITTLSLAETTLRTKEKLHLIGYAKKYLDYKGSFLMFFSLVLGVYAALLAYLIASGESLSILFFNSPIYSTICGIVFWLFLSTLSYFGLKSLSRGEFLGTTIIFLLIISIILLFAPKINLSNFYHQSNISFFSYLSPIGVIIFAFMGYASIPEIKSIIDKKIKMKKAIIFGILLTALIYIIFTFVTIGYLGSNINEIALISLGKPFILLGLFTIFTSYLSYSIVFMDILKFDYKQKHLKAWLYAISIPLILYLALELTNTSSFTKVLEISGIFSGGLTTILILLINEKAKYLGNRIPEFKINIKKSFFWFLIVFFTLGAFEEILKVLKIT